MQLNPYLNFNGQCKEAFEFYAQCLGGKITRMLTYADTPMKDHVPAGTAVKIVHARLVVGEEVLMGSDAMEKYETPQGFSVTINVEDTAEAERVFAALAEGGNMGMPIQETFWAKRFGIVVDRFGTPWMVNCEKVP